MQKQGTCPLLQPGGGQVYHSDRVQPTTEGSQGRNRSTDHGMLLIDLLLSQSGYLYTVQVHLPRMTPLSELALIRQSAMTTRQSNARNSSAKRPSFQMTLVCVEFTKVSSIDSIARRNSNTLNKRAHIESVISTNVKEKGQNPKEEISIAGCSSTYMSPQEYLGGWS